MVLRSNRSPRVQMLDEGLADYSYRIGKQLLAQRSAESKKRAGQFLTHPLVARFMARKIGWIQEGGSVLDPAIGSGVLACAIIEEAIARGAPSELFIYGFDTDGGLCDIAIQSLERARLQAAQYGIRVHFDVQARDFILDYIPMQQQSFFPSHTTGAGKLRRFQYIIANPPYFKLKTDDERVKALAGQVKGHTNIYTVFMALSAQLLADDGLACFIVPRSFCSGAYHSGFRKDFIEQNIPLQFHLFESRQEAFKDDTVLQENIIFTFRKRRSGEQLTAPVVSSSKGIDELGDLLLKHQVLPELFLGQYNGVVFFRLPVCDLDDEIIATIDGWPNSLYKAGLEVSTGPVVAFRAKQFLTTDGAVAEGQAAPLLWMQNVEPQIVAWPALRGRKPQGISMESQINQLLLPTRNYVLLRRFSAKEDARRLTSAPFLQRECSHEFVGFENHLNYIYKRNGELSEIEAIGLSAIFNSALIDRYFRITNGNTQINALELRSLGLPPMSVIQEIGDAVGESTDGVAINRLVFDILRKHGFLSLDFPTFSETRFNMGKIQEAQDILKTLGLPKRQQNEMAALTLLVLAQLSEDTPWVMASRRSLRIHDILIEMRDRYDRDYAENTRETIRRQVLHQFVQAGLVELNPDDPSLPTNSPRTHYALSSATIETIRSYGTDDWEEAARAFLQNQRALIETYERKRDQYKVSLTLPGGQEYHLSPGIHNELQAAIVEEFGPRFAPGATVIYVGDTANKTLHIDEDSFEMLGIPSPSHDKLPDVVIFDAIRNLLYLIEAVTSHGPVSPKRQVELAELVASCMASVVYVTAFPDFQTFKEFLTEIAWETEVWIADTPSHMIHFNGDRFLGTVTC